MNVNIPDMFKQRLVFGDVLISFISYTDDGGDIACPTYKEVFPDDDVENCDLKVTMNGVDVPVELIEHLFTRYVKHHTKQMLEEELNDRLTVIDNLTETIRSKLLKMFGIEDDEYDRY